MDTSALGKLAAELMEEIADVEGELRTVAIVFEVDEEESTRIDYKCNDDRRWVQRAFFDEAMASVDFSPVEDDAE